MNQKTVNLALAKETRVTFVDYRGELQRGVYSTENGEFCFRMPEPQFSTVFTDFPVEGVTWIRGHHEPGSPEARALKTANALARESQEPDCVADRSRRIFLRSTP